MIYTKDTVRGAIDITDMDSVGKMLKAMVDTDKVSSNKGKMKTGVRYFNNNNDITTKEQYYFDPEGKRVVDDTKANHRLAHNYYGLLTKQKVGYLVGKPMNISSKDDLYTDLINRNLGDKWNHIMQELAKNSTNKGVEYLYCFVNEEGKFDYVVCPAEQIIPIYDNGFKTKLVEVIRYYETTNFRGESKTTLEWWTAEGVTYYTQHGDTFELDLTRGEKGKMPHFMINGVGHTFKQVPFVPFKNNEEEISDLFLIKDLVDNYDDITSRLANDLEEIQKAIYVLKGYNGTDSGEFMNNLRYYKMIKVDEDGGVDKLEVHIPIEATNAHLKRLEDDIYRLGMGVDVSAERLGNSSGVALKFLYSLLDLKADISEVQYRIAIRQFVNILTVFLEAQEGVEFDEHSVKVVFNRAMLVNTKEQILNVVNSFGMLSKETLLGNHPFVTDVDYEIAQMEAEGVEFTKPLMNSGGTPPKDKQDRTGNYEHNEKTGGEE